MNKREPGGENFSPPYQYKIKFFTLFKLYFKRDFLVIESERAPLKLFELIEKGSEILGKSLKDKLISKGKLKRGAIILIKGKNVLHLKELETEIYPEDDIVFFPPGGGG